MALPRRSLLGTLARGALVFQAGLGGLAILPRSVSAAAKPKAVATWGRIAPATQCASASCSACGGCCHANNCCGVTYSFCSPTASCCCVDSCQSGSTRVYNAKVTTYTCGTVSNSNLCCYTSIAGTNSC